MVVIEKDNITRAYVLNPNNLEGLLTTGVDYVWVSPCTYADIRKWGRDLFTIESDPASLKTGCMGTFRGAKIYMSKGVPDDYLILVPKKENPGLVQNQVEGGLVFHKWLDESRPSWEQPSDAPKVAPERVSVELTDEQLGNLFK
jgi:hypothetical protein